MQDTRSIRLSQEDWNALLLVAVQNGYPNRTEYIRATLKTAPVTLPWNSKQPDADMETTMANAKWQTSIASLDVLTSETAKFLARAEAAEAELETYKEKLQASISAYDRLAVDAKEFLSRAEVAEAEIPRLEAKIQATSLGLFPPVTTTPIAYEISGTSSAIIEKRLPQRPTVEGLYPGWTDKKKKRWDTDTYKHKQWCLDIAEEILDIVYGKE